MKEKDLYLFLQYQNSIVVGRIKLPDKILIVEDEIDTLNLAKMILEGEGFDIITATNGEEGLKKVINEWPDLILSDLVMPVKSGLELCNALKSNPRTKLIPIVIFTVLGRDVDKKLCEDAGAEGHLIKPFTQNSLISEINKQLERIRFDKFSRLLELNHKSIESHNFLLEIDPDTQYERSIRDFTVEAHSNRKAIITITPKSGVIHKLLKDEEGIEFYQTTEMIISPILEDQNRKDIALIYDNISELIVSIGFKQAHNFTRKTLELLAEYNSTSLFLFNPAAHSKNESNSIRNLFSNRIIFDKDGLRVIKLT